MGIADPPPRIRRRGRAAVDAGTRSPFPWRSRAVALLALLAPIAAAGTADAGDRAGDRAHADYLYRCSGCHGLDGDGLPRAGIPPFPGLVGAFAADPEGRVYLLHVPGVVGSGLDDARIAAVLNYVIDAWAGDASAGLAPFSVEEVRRLRARPVADVVAYRRAVVARLAAKGVAVAPYPWP